MRFYQGSQIEKTRVIVLILDKNDIRSQLESYFEDNNISKKDQSKRVNQIFGMAKDGKFTDYIMDDFWKVINDCNFLLKSAKKENIEYYEKLGSQFKNNEAKND